jgi:hypothetical protein
MANELDRHSLDAFRYMAEGAKYRFDVNWGLSSLHVRKPTGFDFAREDIIEGEIISKRIISDGV